MIVFLLLVIVAIALGIVGVVVKGLLYLLFTGIGVLLITFSWVCPVDAAPKLAKAPRPLIFVASPAS